MSERSESTPNESLEDAEATVRADADDVSPRLACWICRQPLEPVEFVRWRGEPVHPDCLIQDPRYLADD